MNTPSWNPQRYVLGLAAALLALALGGALAAAAPVFPQPLLTAQTLPAFVAANHLTADQAKTLQADVDAVAAKEKEIADFRAGMTPATQKSKANSLKYQSLQRELMVGQHQLSTDQARFTPAPPKAVVPTKPKR